MGEQVDRLLQAALTLPDEDQLQLLDALAAALDERGVRPFDESWVAEIERRSAEYDAGAIQAVPWPQVRARASSAMRGRAARG